jgi:hypothetical protein
MFVNIYIQSTRKKRDTTKCDISFVILLSNSDAAAIRH